MAWQFPISFFSFLCPSNTDDFGRFSSQTECLSHLDKEEMIHNAELFRRHYQNTNFFFFLTIPKPQNNFAFLFFLPV